MKPTWIVVADNTLARFFTVDTESSPLEELSQLTHEKGRLLDNDLTTDIPGKIRASNGVGHAFEQATDPKRHEAENFAKQITGSLTEALNANKFEQLVLVAGPAFLGMLRKELPETLSKRVSFSLDKSIASQSPADIRSHLPKYLPTI
ncbi:MAG: host attachment protein [Methylococcales bacterium]|nr:host attachment protein [Methylococcales bacterium]